MSVAVSPTTIVVIASSTIAPAFVALFPVVVVAITVTTAIVPTIAVATTALLVARYVLAFIPPVLDEIDALAAGTVFVAVLAPVLGMTGRDAQIDRWAMDGDALDEDRLAIDDRRTWIAADIDLAIETGLTNADRDTDISGVGRGRK
ncbi:MAG: hypothetical protein H6R13_2624 [Proteobacteria bacterium]|nr:hypothetical protein [Pseudomonadota bacterium]